MSLDEVYSLAHTAECRLQLSTNRPDRDLRIVVGHLLHYESLRLRIVEIEHDVGRRERARLRGVRQLDRTPSSDDQGTQPPPSSTSPVDDADPDVNQKDTENPEEGLSLTRFQSGSSRPPLQAIEDSQDSALEEPDTKEIEQALGQPANVQLVKQIEKIRRCSCHDDHDAPHIDQIWTLPPSSQDKPGTVRAIGRAAD